MQFNEKMIYLMEVTNSSNKTLANAINVDPSMISLIRTGRRSQPRNDDHIHAMADFFASKINTEYQKGALQEVILHVQTSQLNNRSQLSSLLFHWLHGDLEESRYSMQNLMKEMNEGTKNGSVSASASTSALPILSSPSASTESADSRGADSPSPAAVRQEQNMAVEQNRPAPVLYYGNEEKKEAVCNFYAHVLAMEKPCTLYILTEESTLWFTEERDFWNQLRSWKLQLLSRGFRIVQILPPQTAPQFYDTILHWVPLYLTGMVEVYFYPRMRDNVFRHDYLIAENEIIFYSTAVATDPDNSYTLVSQKPLFIEANFRIFKGLLSGCLPAIRQYSSSSDFYNVLMRYTRIESDFINSSLCLPFFLLPEEIYKEYVPGNAAFQGNQDLTVYLRNYSQEQKEQLSRLHGMQICPVASANMVKKGRVFFHLPGDHKPIAYTPASYRAHLLALIAFIKENPNYDFVPVPYETENYHIVMIKKDHMALLIREGDPSICFEITEPELITPFYEQQIFYCDKILTSRASRRNIIDWLQDIADALR